jgi:mannan endo-1,4-beta-mannosidase
MVATRFVTPLLYMLSTWGSSYAAKPFAASNLYYAAGLNNDQQQFLFQGLQDAGVKVLRVWLDGESARHSRAVL